MHRKNTSSDVKNICERGENYGLGMCQRQGNICEKRKKKKLQWKVKRAETHILLWLGASCDKESRKYQQLSKVPKLEYQTRLRQKGIH